MLPQIPVIGFVGFFYYLIAVPDIAIFWTPPLFFDFDINLFGGKVMIQYYEQVSTFQLGINVVALYASVVYWNEWQWQQHRAPYYEGQDQIDQIGKE